MIKFSEFVAQKSQQQNESFLDDFKFMMNRGHDNPNYMRFVQIEPSNLKAVKKFLNLKNIKHLVHDTRSPEGKGKFTILLDKGTDSNYNLDSLRREILNLTNDIEDNDPVVNPVFQPQF